MAKNLICSGILVVLCLLADFTSAQEPEKAAEEPKFTVAVITNAGGAHLSAYFTALKASGEAEAVVLADQHGTNVELARKILGEKLVAVHQDRDRLLAEEKPDMALVSMEARLAPESIAAALDAGCHVLAEKPACLNPGDFDSLVVKAEKKGLHLMLALANRLNPEILKAKALVAKGAIGQIYNVQMNLIEDQRRLTSKAYHSSWYADKDRAGGGHLTWLGIHWLDLAMYITDASVSHVAGFSGNVGGQPITIEDSVALSMRFDNGTFGTLSSGYYLDRGYQSMLKVWGSEGWLEIESESPRRVRWHSTASGTPVDEEFTGAGDHSAYTTFVAACVRASAGLEEPPITGRECLRVLKVVYGSYEAAESGKSVVVSNTQ
jgi:predicted dehydrogenase